MSKTSTREDALIKETVKSFKGYKVGESFFVPNATVKDVTYLREPFKKAGLGFTMRQVKNDEIYGVSGVRIWRERGAYDEEL